MAFTVGIDIGGTKISCGVVAADGQIVSTRRTDTPYGDVSQAVEVIQQLVGELVSSYPIESVGIGAPGWVSADRSFVYHAPNVGWHDVDFAPLVSKALNLPVVVENDANGAAWAEYRFGAGQGASHLILLTVGTGIGGGVVLNGQLYRGALGTAGEFGHVQVVPDGVQCRCGGRGCFERYSSGEALVKKARELAVQDRSRAELLLKLSDGRPEDIRGRHVTQAAQEGCPVALEAFNETAYWMGRGLADLAMGWNPDRFVLGGGVTEAGELFLRPTREAFAAALAEQNISKLLVPVVAAELGNKAGLVGVADLARQ